MPVGPAGTYVATVPVRYTGSRKVSAPGQCRWGFVRKSLLLACMKAHNSQLYLLLLEPDQVGINGVLFVHATRIARGFCRDSVDLRRVVPRYGSHTWVRPHTHTHTPAGNQPALSSRLLPPASKFYSKQQ